MGRKLLVGACVYLIGGCLVSGWGGRPRFHIVGGVICRRQKVSPFPSVREVPRHFLRHACRAAVLLTAGSSSDSPPSQRQRVADRPVRAFGTGTRDPKFMVG